MKKLILSIAVIGFLASCSSSTEEATKTEETNVETAAVGGDYYCPMKCEGDKTYAEAGKCGACGMDLVSKNKTEEIEEATETEEEVHDHEHNHDEEGHQH